MATTNGAHTPSHQVADPLGSVPAVPSDGGISTPLGRLAPVPPQPGAQNPSSINQRPSTRPAPVDGFNMPTPERR